METVIDVKKIVLKVIPAQMANAFVRKHHYSDKVVQNSTPHLGAFYNNILHGVMQFGPSINKKGTIRLVKNTHWNGFIELNRMAFDDVLPKNSESRALSIDKECELTKPVLDFTEIAKRGAAMYKGKSSPQKELAV